MSKYFIKNFAVIFVIQTVRQVFYQNGGLFLLLMTMQGEVTLF